jgi:putative phage-type endonuclease
MDKLLNEVIFKLNTFDNNNNDNYNIKNIYHIGKVIYDELKLKYDIDYELIIMIINNHYNNNQSRICYRNYDKLFDKIKIPKKYQKLENHFQKLKNLPQPEQRTKEWFDYRHNRITASDTAAAIDLNPYEPVESFILKKCDPTHKFLDNQNVYHGKKYEPIATLIYEYIYNIKVIEFGALPSDKYKILGASPDGICSCSTLDNKFSDMLGRMLEIKCTTTRHIYTKGRIHGNICPYYYYCQVQQQLECCDLEECDFWQCKLIEYNNRNDYLSDLCNDTIHTVGINEEKIEIDNKIKSGIILKFLPKKWEPEFEGDNIEWKSKFIYPSRLDMNIIEYDSWVVSTLSNWINENIELANDFYFEKVIYWKLESSHNVLIKRDRSFMNNILPILEKTWNQVLYYRENLNKLDELKEIIEKRKKYKKYETEITVNNNYLIKNKFNFLYETVKINKDINKNNNLENNNLENNNLENNCDFID